MSIKYKTRNNESPQGKLKILLYCNEADFNPWFQKISDKVLEVFDCAVLYPFEDETDLSKHILSQNVQLLMVLVTENSITQKDSSLDHYITDAIDAHIPVFFLRTAPLDFDAFSKRFDTLHCFDASALESEDKQEIEHLNEQLQNKLHQLLASDDQLEQIRSSFSAYIFLSYRKKDYQYVHALMNLIHSDPRFRDIAIWFDDYLIPGENYNYAIEHSLRKSEAFTLLVTPNLLQDNNYVMDTEYPIAKEEKIPILPFEFVPTDKESLSEKYPGLPRCTDASDSDVCDAILTRLISSLGLNVKNNSPEHLFYIGLAYLMGIDVEKNGTLARELIEGAISGGYHEGTLKLGLMYAEGNGIPKDYKTAIYWLEIYLTNLGDIHIPLADSENYLNNVTRSEESEFARAKLRKQMEAASLLVRLYEKTDTFNTALYPYIAAIFKESLDVQLAFHLLCTRYTTVTGYKKVKGPDGKWKLGPAIHTPIWRTTGMGIDHEFIKTLHTLVFCLSADIEISRRLDLLGCIQEAYRKMLELADDRDSLFCPLTDTRKFLQARDTEIIRLLRELTE